MLSRSGSYMAELKKTHSDRGAFRSGMGDQSLAHERELLFIEQERMEELEESKEIVTDLALAERQFKYFNKQM